MRCNAREYSSVKEITHIRGEKTCFHMMCKGLYSEFSYEPMEGLIDRVSILRERLQRLPPLRGEISENCNQPKSTPQDNWPDNPKLQMEPGNVD